MSPLGVADPLFFIDIAVPRDVDPGVHALPGCFLYDIDDLEAVVAETLAGRRVEAERAELLVLEEAERFREWHAALGVVPAITSLVPMPRRSARRSSPSSPRFPPRRARRSSALTAQMFNKLLHLRPCG